MIFLLVGVEVIDKRASPAGGGKQQVCVGDQEGKEEINGGSLNIGCLSRVEPHQLLFPAALRGQ